MYVHTYVFCNAMFVQIRTYRVSINGNMQSYVRCIHTHTYTISSGKFYMTMLTFGNLLHACTWASKLPCRDRLKHTACKVNAGFRRFRSGSCCLEIRGIRSLPSGSRVATWGRGVRVEDSCNVDLHSMPSFKHLLTLVTSLPRAWFLLRLPSVINYASFLNGRNDLESSPKRSLQIPRCVRTPLWCGWCRIPGLLVVWRVPGFGRWGLLGKIRL